ncbi:hypothetical protein K7432_018620, partial [Basidiobolus ranarum]
TLYPTVRTVIKTDTAGHIHTEYHSSTDTKTIDHHRNDHSQSDKEVTRERTVTEPAVTVTEPTVTIYPSVRTIIKTDSTGRNRTEIRTVTITDSIQNHNNTESVVSDSNSGKVATGEITVTEPTITVTKPTVTLYPTVRTVIKTDTAGHIHTEYHSSTVTKTVDHHRNEHSQSDEEVTSNRTVTEPTVTITEPTVTIYPSVRTIIKTDSTGRNRTEIRTVTVTDNIQHHSNTESVVSDFNSGTVATGEITVTEPTITVTKHTVTLYPTVRTVIKTDTAGHIHTEYHSSTVTKTIDHHRNDHSQSDKEVASERTATEATVT